MPGRFKVYTGAPSSTGEPPPTTLLPTIPRGDPTAGGPVDDVDNVVGDEGYGYYAPGTFWLMDCGGSFAAGDDLATDGSGRAVLAGTGDVVVARALEGSSGAGDVAWCPWAGRTTL